MLTLRVKRKHAAMVMVAARALNIYNIKKSKIIHTVILTNG
jgi:hypothetical protein